MKPILMLLMAVSIVGCSQRAVYENIQHHNRQECAKLPESEFEECMNNAERSYDEYQEKRREAIKE